MHFKIQIFALYIATIAILPEFVVSLDLLGFWRSSPQDQVVDHLDLSKDDHDVLLLSLNRLGETDGFSNVALYPPMECSQFLNLHPLKNRHGCGLWYGPNFPGLSSSMAKDSTAHTVNSCQFDIQVRAYFHPVAGGPKRYIPSIGRGVKGQITFADVEQLVPGEGARQHVSAQAVRIPLGNDRGVKEGRYLTSTLLNLEKNCTDMVMRKLPNLLRNEDVEKKCSFWVGPTLNHMMGVQSCIFTDVNQKLEFSTLEPRRVTPGVLEKIALLVQNLIKIYHGA